MHTPLFEIARGTSRARGAAASGGCAGPPRTLNRHLGEGRDPRHSGRHRCLACTLGRWTPA
ncbi:hypothetical protein C725_2511 [Pacificimonas flava]|uniref:Uncharacterized protein n=1 Tax=Pacificimonas flava TaxID=1234595 RepID=M2SA17_9SPHN|nr:hypothetical protein C725_2511 [Pacificimonas flava]